MAATAAFSPRLAGFSMTATKCPGAVAALGALEIDDLAGHVVSETRLPTTSTQVPIHATLTGSDRCEAEGITARAFAPVLALCRALIEAGHPPGRALNAYRGNILCLLIRSIGEAAQLEPSPRGVGFVRRPAVRGGPPVRKNGAAHHLTFLPRTRTSGGVLP